MEMIRSLGMRPVEGKTPQSWGLFKCPFCGKEFELRLSHANRNKSCGCAKGELCAQAKTIHGSAHRGKKARLYKIWCKIKERCNNPNSSRYAFYGARGVRMCEQWEEYKEFEEWAVSNGYSENLEIDRKNFTGDYSPTNCRWVTQTENKRNRRTSKLSMEKARVIRAKNPQYKSEMRALAAEYGVTINTIYSVVRNKTWKEGKEVQEVTNGER